MKKHDKWAVLEYLDGDYKGARFIIVASENKDHSKVDGKVLYKCIDVVNSKKAAHKLCDATHDVNVAAYLDSIHEGMDKIKFLAKKLLNKEPLEEANVAITDRGFFVSHVEYEEAANNTRRIWSKLIDPKDWSVTQLRAMADYMERQMGGHNG